jgi:Tfp pilus assembly protein PilN
MNRLGIELGPHVIRAALIGARAAGIRTAPHNRALEIQWDPEQPDESIHALGEQVGTPRRIAVAVDLPLLITKRVKLPALSASERRDILRVEPDRFFAIRSDGIVPAVRADDDLVFAASETRLGSWITALERIAPVDLVEPAPQSLARALTRASIRDAVVLIDQTPSGLTLIEIVDGRIRRARRLFADIAAAVAALRSDPAHPAPAVVYASPESEGGSLTLASLIGDTTLKSLPTMAGLPGPFLTAYGAVLGLDVDVDAAATLISPTQHRTIQGRRHRVLGLAVLALAASLVFALLSMDASRARATRELDASLTALRQRAQPALALSAELDSLARRQHAIRAIETQRPDPLEVLLALTHRLPPGAFIRGIRTAGPEWQVDGYAPNAANVLSALGAAPQLKDVRFLSAMNRVEFRNQPYESFALAFRFASTP